MTRAPLLRTILTGKLLASKPLGKVTLGMPRVAATDWDSYATFFSDATGAAAGRRAATREGMWT